jgi:hypothetical protein
MSRTFALQLLVVMGLQHHIAMGAPVQFPGNGHYYDLVTASFTWSEARLAAEAQSFGGVPGHLATLTSAAEDSFVRTTFSAAVVEYVGPWFGAEWDHQGIGPTGGWSWVTGEPFANYVGWNFGEPNHLEGSEDAIHFSGSGWNDIDRSRNDTIGYFVEFEVPEPATAVLVTLIVAAAYATRVKRLIRPCLLLRNRSAASLESPTERHADEEKETATKFG